MLVPGPQSSSPDQLVMPQYLGVDICDQLDEVARQNPANTLEHYVGEVAIILRKMGRYADEVTAIDTWLHGISAADKARAPKGAQISDEISDFVGNRPVYAHNAVF